MFIKPAECAHHMYLKTIKVKNVLTSCRLYKRIKISAKINKIMQ